MLNSFHVSVFALAALTLVAQEAQAPNPQNATPGTHAPWNGNGRGRQGQYQDRNRREHGPLAELGLSEAQWTQIRQIREAHKNRGPEGRKEMRFEVLAVLSEPQRQKLFQMEARRRRGSEREGSRQEHQGQE